MKHNKDLFVDEILEDLELQESPDRESCHVLLKTLSENAHEMGRVMSPPGYEDFLVRSLRAKVQRRSLWRRFVSGLLRPLDIPRWAVGFGLFVVFLSGSLYVFKSRPTVEMGMSALLVGQLQDMDQVFAERWLAAVADSATREDVMSNDPVIVAMEMGAGDLERALKSVSKLVPFGGTE